MKNYFLVLFLLSGLFSYSQDDAGKNKNFRFEPEGRVQFIYPIQFGDHALADAHDTSFGFGMSLSFFNFRNFRFTPGFDRVQYKVRKNNLVGNFQNSNYLSIYGAFSYEIAVNKKFRVLPDVGIGYVDVAQRSGGRNFGDQEGTEFRAGISFDYSVEKHISIFLAGRYIYSSLNMTTNAAFEDYYGKANQFQLCIGVRVH